MMTNLWRRCGTAWGWPWTGLGAVLFLCWTNLFAQTDAVSVLEAALAAHGGPEAVSASARTIYRGSWQTIRGGEPAGSFRFFVHAGCKGGCASRCEARTWSGSTPATVNRARC